jgi:hypothetical protein
MGWQQYTKQPVTENRLATANYPQIQQSRLYVFTQKSSRLRCLLRVKGLVICFYFGWSGSILQFRQNIIKVGSKSWLLIYLQQKYNFEPTLALL